MFRWIWKCRSLDFFAKHEHWDLARDQNVGWMGGGGVVYKDATNDVVGWLKGGSRLGFGRFG